MLKSFFCRNSQNIIVILNKKYCMSYLKTSDGIKLYYEDCGVGEVLIFLHGLNSSHKINKDFYDEFRDEFRVILYDQRGHGDSDKSDIHMNVKRLGQDLKEIIDALNLDDVTLIGHSMGAATIYSYVNQFGCKNLKRIVASDMSPYMRNDGWSGGIAQGKWSDEDFMRDLDYIFDDVGHAAFHISKSIMNPGLANVSSEMKNDLINKYRQGTDTLTMASLWFSLFRTDQRPAINKINVTFLYIMPEMPLYSIESINYIKSHVKDSFVLENDFPKTTHAIWRQMPHEVANSIKRFINDYSD